MSATPQREPIETADERLAREAELMEEARASIAFEEIEAWVNSWGTPNSLPKPTPRK